MIVAPGERCRSRVRVDGTVQGVGFRPFVFRLAEELALGGFVGNDERGVVLEVEGTAGAVATFLERVRAEAPPLARVERVTAEPVEPLNGAGFEIIASERHGRPDALVSPDTATCADCLAELWDPGDRRHRYPFVNCTNCGPRFTIVRGVPYDRPLTTMAGFEMCAACRAEYEDPRDRRFHAQPNACPACGPRAELIGPAPAGAADAVAAAAALLRDGAIVAVKGLGGYHLACRADDARAVAALRSRKQREDKPFALLVADVAAAREPRRARRAVGRPAVLAGAADRARAAAAGRARGPGGRAGCARARRRAALLAAAPPARPRRGLRARADQRQRVRRADRLSRRRRARAPRPASRTPSSSTTARSTSAPTTPSRAPCAGGR